MFKEKTSSNLLKRFAIIYNPAISVRARERQHSEITPVSIEHSRTYQDNEDDYAAAYTIDLNLDTKSRTTSGRDGKAWLKVKLANTNCIHQAVGYYKNGNPIIAWTCTSSDCSCKGNIYCSLYFLTVSSKRASTDDL